MPNHNQGDQTSALAAVYEDVAQQIWEEYYLKFSEFLTQHEFSYHTAPLPFAAWSGIAHALADASGLRVILQAAILEADKDDPERLRLIENREVDVAEPVFL